MRYLILGGLIKHFMFESFMRYLIQVDLIKYVLVLNILLARQQQLTAKQQLNYRYRSSVTCQSIAAPKGLDLKLVQAYQEVLSFL